MERTVDSQPLSLASGVAVTSVARLDAGARLAIGELTTGAADGSYVLTAEAGTHKPSELHLYVRVP